MMRVAMLVLLLGLSVVARAQDDDAALDTPSHGDGIPERIEQLEREWAEDVGTKDPADEPVDTPDADEAVEGAAEHEAEAAKPQPRVEEPPRAKPRSALGKALPDPIGKRDSEGVKSDSAGTAPAQGTPSRAERRATTPEE